MKSKKERKEEVWKTYREAIAAALKAYEEALAKIDKEG